MDGAWPRRLSTSEDIPPLKVAFLGQSGPYAIPALQALLGAAAYGRSFVLTVVVEGVKGRRRDMGRSQHRINAGVKAHKIQHPAQQSVDHDLNALAVGAGVPCLQTKDVNAPGALRLLRRFEVDLLVCVGFDRLFNSEVLNWPKCGALNVHPSELPNFRGPAPIFWAAKAGVQSVSVSLHHLDDRADHGPILDMRSQKLKEFSTGGHAFTLAGRLAGELLLETLCGHEQRFELPVGTPQQHAQASKAPRPRPEDAKIESQSWHCRRLANFLCVAPFFRTPWVRLGSETFFMRRALRYQHGRKLPGQYLLQGERLYLQCLDGVVETEIQV